jgi:hypothetical protein
LIALDWQRRWPFKVLLESSVLRQKRRKGTEKLCFLSTGGGGARPLPPPSTVLGLLSPPLLSSTTLHSHYHFWQQIQRARERCFSSLGKGSRHIWAKMILSLLLFLQTASLRLDRTRPPNLSLVNNVHGLQGQKRRRATADDTVLQ